MTIEMEKVLKLVEEMEAEEKKTVYVPVYYKRHGKMFRRSYDDMQRTPRYKELLSKDGPIRSKKVFRCAECGKMVDYFSLERWLCDFDIEDGCTCSTCYAEDLGDDI